MRETSVHRKTEYVMKVNQSEPEKVITMANEDKGTAFPDVKGDKGIDLFLRTRWARVGMTFLLVVITLWVKGQDRVYTLNNFAPLIYNPATPTMDHEGSLRFFHDEYHLGVSDFISTNSFSAEYPWINKENGRRFLGVGIHFTERDLGQSDMLKTYRSGLSLSSNVQLGVDHYLNLGLAADYYERTTSMQGLSTGSQWLAEEFRYDPNAPLGETFANTRVNYLSMGAGLVWQWMEGSAQKAIAGLTAFHLNQPEERFFQQSVRIDPTIQGQFGMTLYQDRTLRVFPQVFYTQVSGRASWRGIVTTTFPFVNTNPYDIIGSGSFDLLVDYGLEEDASIGVRFNQPGFSVGFSYQFPIGGSEGTYLRNGLQLGVSVSKLLWKKQPKRVVIESTPQRRNFDFGSREVTTVRQESEIELIRKQLEALDKVRSLQFELEKNFQFAFGKSELVARSDDFLEELSGMLAEHERFTVQVIGHTDNIGKPQANYELSLDRARTIVTELVALGVDEDRITAVGKGDTDPVTSNDTEEGRSKNRRVGFIITIER
ncbi:MAG: PorP/SprF family type IX secretion system membrane protein [Bacteroidota bacterium]